MSKILVEKSNGELEPFDRAKLKKSILNSSASIVITNDVISEVEKNLVDRMTTKEIYRKAFETLNQNEKPVAARYSLRRSLLSLGPTGFPFEKLIAKIYEKKGYHTETNMTLQGSCIDHEVDVLAANEEDCLIIEAKFHNELNTKTDSRVTLYFKSRFDDLRTKEIKIGKRKMNPTRGIIITNTKFTDNAIKYASCAGLGLVGWDHPNKRGNLYDLIDDTKTYPITIIDSISKSEKAILLNKKIITCEDLINANINNFFDNTRSGEIQREVEMIMNNK